MSSTGVRLEGFKEFQAKLKDSAKLDDVRRAVQYRGSRLQQIAHDLAPNRTGQLQRSITHEERDGGFTAEIAPHTNYAAYVEYGTRYKEARPYIRPAFMQESQGLKEDLKRLMK